MFLLDEFKNLNAFEFMQKSDTVFIILDEMSFCFCYS